VSVRTFPGAAYRISAVEMALRADGIGPGKRHPLDV
jgi:hypothetical protein